MTFSAQITKSHPIHIRNDESKKRKKVGILLIHFACMLLHAEKSAHYLSHALIFLVPCLHACVTKGESKPPTCCAST